MRTLLFALACVAGLAATTVGASAQNPYCDQYARDYANRNAPSGNAVVGGAVTGAIGGAIIGGIVGGNRGVGTGAAVGAGVGALGGAASNSQAWNNAYNTAYNQCIRGSAPAAQRGPQYQPWTPEWYAACGARYRSFNPNDGTWLNNDGNRYFCSL